MLKFDLKPNIQYCFLYTKFQENRNIIEAIKVLPFVQQYSRHDVILPAKSFKTQIHTKRYSGGYMLKILLKSTVLFGHTSLTK